MPVLPSGGSAFQLVGACTGAVATSLPTRRDVEGDQLLAERQKGLAPFACRSQVDRPSSHPTSTRSAHH